MRSTQENDSQVLNYSAPEIRVCALTTDCFCLNSSSWNEDPFISDAEDRNVIDSYSIWK